MSVGGHRVGAAGVIFHKILLRVQNAFTDVFRGGGGRAGVMGIGNAFSRDRGHTIVWWAKVAFGLRSIGRVADAAILGFVDLQPLDSKRIDIDAIFGCRRLCGGQGGCLG